MSVNSTNLTVTLRRFPCGLRFENSRTYDQRLEKLQGCACGRRWSVLGADFDGWLHVIF